MKLTLSAKLFLLFLLMNVSSVTVLVITNNNFSRWGFDLYTRYLILEKIQNLANTLPPEYKKTKSWEFLKDSPETWESMIRSTWLLNDSNIFVLTKNSAAPESAATENNSPGQDKRSVAFLLQNLGMFDKWKKPVVGTERAFNEFSDEEIIPITTNNETIGWLAIDLGPRVPHPKDKELIRKQSIKFNTVGCVMLLISAIVVFFFSKHLLAPIQQLSIAMKALSHRHFGARMPVKRSDELGTLAKGFNTMASQLQTYDHNQRQWLSDISHELRTPLSVLIGEIDAFQDGVFKLDSVSLAALGDEAKHLQKIVEDLHFISLAEANAFSMEKSIVKPLMVLTQVVYFFDNRLRKKTISIDIQIEPTAVDIEIVGDEVRLKQVFSNLVENALRYMNTPGVLTIRQDQVDGKLIIIFEDSGPGVSEEALPHLFDRLYRADPSRNRKTGGSGIGLAICKTIITGHHGTITAKNVENGGLKIVISLPITTTDAVSKHFEG